MKCRLNQRFVFGFEKLHSKLDCFAVCGFYSHKHVIWASHKLTAFNENLANIRVEDSPRRIGRVRRFNDDAPVGDTNFAFAAFVAACNFAHDVRRIARRTRLSEHAENYLLAVIKICVVKVAHFFSLFAEVIRLRKVSQRRSQQGF